MCLNLEERSLTDLMETLVKEVKLKNERTIILCFELVEGINLDVINDDLLSEYKKLEAKANKILNTKKGNKNESRN